MGHTSRTISRSLTPRIGIVEMHGLYFCVDTMVPDLWTQRAYQKDNVCNQQTRDEELSDKERTLIQADKPNHVFFPLRCLFSEISPIAFLSQP